MLRPNAFYYCNETDANNSIDSITVRVLEGFLTVYADVSNRKLQLITEGFRVHVFLDWIVPTLRERERCISGTPTETRSRYTKSRNK